MDRNNLYGYEPSIPAAVIFIILFAATTLYHVYQLTKARCWYFIPFVVGGVCMFLTFNSPCPREHDQIKKELILT